VRRRLRHKRRQVYADSSEGGFELTAISDVRITGRLGEGVTCVVYRGEWNGRGVTLKLYKSGAVEWHARYHHQELAEFEYRRNLEFYEAPGLARYVAQPLGYLSTGCVSAMIQERLDGVLYHRYFRERNGEVPEALRDHVRRILDLAHEASLYDVDLHARNVMVVTSEDGEPIPKLFDFNFIPFYVRPRNPLTALMLKTGLLGHRSRDLRKLRNFHKFKRWERKPLYTDNL
jgi:hypothetical protein